ncbi:MAG: leucine-rich repeat protein [Alistipes sp.]|nr:leucine-rich repeat protein [Alistipes sp.]
MKQYAYILFALILLFTSCEPASYDDSGVLSRLDELEEQVSELEGRIEELETECNKATEDIAALRAIIEVLQSRDYVTSVTPIMDGDKVIGYTITFANSAPLTIYTCNFEDDDESIIVAITEGETEVVITLSDGSKITIPKSSAPLPTDYCEKLEDVEFMRYCYEKFDINGDKILSESEAKAIRAVNIDSKQNIYSVKGIEYFVNLESFQAYNAIALRTLDLSKNTNLRTIKEQALYKCSGLESVTLPPTIETIEDDAFHSCSALASINIPDGVKSIGSYAFAGDLQLSEITLPQSIETIGKNAFAATGLHSLVLPESVTVTSQYMCYNCQKLTILTLPTTITSIGYRSFDECNALVEIHCKATTPPTLEQYAFEATVNGRKIFVPHASVDAYKVAWSNFAEQIIGE